MNSQFIEFLYNRKTSFPAPEEARDKAKACDLLSKDIYNDSTRFAYELQQRIYILSSLNYCKMQMMLVVQLITWISRLISAVTI